MFIKILGLRQTIESASETAPATSNKKLKVAQTPMSTLETILLVIEQEKRDKSNFVSKMM